MSITDIDTYCASVMTTAEIAELISKRCTINDKLNILAKYKKMDHIITLCKKINIYMLIFENHSYLYQGMDNYEFELIIDVICNNKLENCRNIYMDFKKKPDEAYYYKNIPDASYYLLENVDKFKIICDKMCDLLFRNGQNVSEYSDARMVKSERICCEKYEAFFKVRNDSKAIFESPVTQIICTDESYTTFLLYILRICAVLNYNESYEYLYSKIRLTPSLEYKLNVKCTVGIYNNGNSTTMYRCKHCEHKLTTYECILIQSLFHTHYMEKKEINHMNKNPQLFKRILSGDFVMNKKFIKILKECWSGAYFPYFANLIWKEHNINNGILEKLFDIFFEKSKTSDRERIYFESLGCIDLIIVICIKSMKKQNLITYDAIKDIMKMEFYNYNKIGSYTKYFHSLGLININQIHIDEKDRIQHVMEKLIV